ncbi:MAG TPA: hypothetical protein VFZ29_03255 [Solirubrobacterales bacterium]
MKQLRERLTYANVMSSIAVFLVLGGGAAFAASQLGKNSVGSKQLKKNAVTAAKIKRNAVTTAKIRNRAVTGAKIDLATLGTVPSATHAGVADSAGNAGTVGGQSVVKVFKTMSAGQTGVSIATLGGFSFVASCEATDVDIEVEGPSGPGFAMEAGGTSGDGALTGAYESSKPGEGGSILVDDLFAGSDAGFGVSSFYGATTPGTVVSGILGYDFETFFKTPPNTCVVSGHLTVG